MSAPHSDVSPRIAQEHPVSWALMSLAHAQRAHAASRLAELGLFPGQELLLMQLWENNGQSQKQLGELLKLDHSTIAKSVQRLERAGLVTRTRSPQDGRITLVHVTDAARELETPVRAVWHELEARLAARLEVEQFDQLSTITAALLSPAGIAN